MSTAKLRVCTNPFFSLDHHGCPCGVASREFVRGRNGLFRATEYIGARRASAEIERDGPNDPEIGKLQTARHHVRYEFERCVIEIDATRYNKRQVQDGVLIAADAATAKLCGVTFRDPEQVREETRSAKGCEVEPLWKQSAPESEEQPNKTGPSKPSRKTKAASKADDEGPAAG